MVKSISAGNNNIPSKNFMKGPKDGFVHKKKSQKFKQISTDKVTLINGSKALNNNNMKQKQKPTSTQMFQEQNKEFSKKSDKKGDKKQQESSKKELNKKVSVQSEEDDSDSEEDINEGVVLQDQSIMEESEESEDTEDEEESDSNESEEEKVPNILGASLADETDEDDEDFEKKLIKEKRGVKMFKGLKSNDKSTDSSQDSSDKLGIEDSMIDNSNDDEEEDDDDSEDDDDDDDEEVEEEEDDDDDEEDEGKEEEVEEEEDEDEELDDEEEGNESTLGLKALLGNSIADDDDDDEDFVEPGEHDEDDDISDEDEEEEEEEEENSTVTNSPSNKSNEDDANSSLEDLKEDERTIFVGNLPKDVTKNQLIKLFKQFGKIDTVRLRGKIAKSVHIPKRVAAITKDVHPKLKSVYAYIKFVSEESVKSAKSLNGTVFEGNYLRVDAVHKSEEKRDHKKCIFLGNLRFNIDDNSVRKHFEQCGEIESVRIIRDNKTGVGKGFGYINFMTEDAVTLALELDGTKLLNREIRVKPNIDHSKTKREKRSHSTESTSSTSHKKSKSNTGSPIPKQNKKNAIRRKIQKTQASPEQGNKFQGQKADINKKDKKNRVDKKKKFLAEKLTVKPKKPSN